MTHRGFFDLKDDGTPWTEAAIAEAFDANPGPITATVWRQRTWSERLLSWPWRPWQTMVTEVHGPLSVSRDGKSFIIHGALE